MKSSVRKEGKDVNPGARMVRMIRTLCARGMTRADMEEEFQVDRRHIYDYLQAIEQLGYVFAEHDGSGERLWFPKSSPLRRTRPFPNPTK